MLLQNRIAETVYFALHRDPEPGPFKAEIQTADSREKGCQCQTHSVPQLQPSRDPFQNGIRIPDLAFPDHNGIPASLPKLIQVLPIASHIPLQFGIPITAVALRAPSVPARMPMPETAVHKYGRSIFRQDNIRAAGQVLAMKAETQAVSMEHSAYQKFRLCIPASNPGHDPAALLLGEHVCHDSGTHLRLGIGNCGDDSTKRPAICFNCLTSSTVNTRAPFRSR